MRFCSQCGAEVSEDANVCTSCSEQLHPVNMVKNIQKNKTDKMKKNKDRTGIFSSAGPDSQLFLALLCISVLPGIVESLLMLMVKHSMSGLTVLLIELFGMILGFIILSVYLSTLNGTRKNPMRLFIAGTGILWMYVIGIVALRLIDELAEFALNHQIQMYWIYYIIYGLIIFISLTAISIILYQTVNRLVVGNSGKLLRHLKIFWRTLLLLVVALFIIPDLIVILFSGELFALPLSFVGTVTGWVLTVCIQGFMLKLAVDGIVQETKKNSFTPETNDTSNKQVRKVIPLVATTVVVALLGYDLISSALYTTVDAIETSVQNDMNQGAFYMAAGDIEMAMFMYDIAYDKTQAWMAFAGDTPEDANQLNTLYYENPSDEQIEYLMAMKTYSISNLEAAILEDKTSSDWYHILLDAYKEQESNKENPIPLSEKQIVIRSDLLNSCIAGQTLVNNSITLKDVKGKKKKIVKAIEPYLEFIDAYGGYKILNKISYNGGINPDIMKQLLTYAEDNPENLLAQYMAFETGSTYLYDGAYHYQRTSEAAIRFRNLYVDQLDNSSDSTLSTIAVNMEIADALMSVLDFSNAVIYLEEAAQLGADGSVMLLAAQCYESLENYEKSLEMAALAVIDNSENSEALNIAMTSALKVGKVTESMKYATLLLELLPSLEGYEYLLSDADMYIYIQYLTVWDKTQWTPQMKYKVYPDLDEEQLHIITENSLFDHYIKALYYTFSDRDFDLAWISTEELLKIMPDSAQILYLAGTINFNKKEFESAIKYYTSSLKIDDSAPTLWFALANAFDAQEDYQQAYNCTLKVAELLQYNNHAVDIYGVQYHNNVLLNNLARKLEQEVN